MLLSQIYSAQYRPESNFRQLIQSQITLVRLVFMFWFDRFSLASLLKWVVPHMLVALEPLQAPNESLYDPNLTSYIGAKF